jgi:hypothetical protein
MSTSDTSMPPSAENPAVVVAAPFGRPASASAAGSGDSQDFVGLFKSLAKRDASMVDDTPAPPETETPAATPPPETAAPDAKAPEADAAKTTKKGLDALQLDPDAPAPAAETDAADAEDAALLKTMTQKAGKKFAELKTKAKQADALALKAAALEAQLKERAKLTDADPLKQELEAKSKRLEELEQALEVANIEYKPDFVRTVTVPKQELAKAATKWADQNKVDHEKVIEAIVEANPAKQEEMLAVLIDDVGRIEARKLENMVVEALAIFEREEYFKANASEVAKEAKSLEAERASKQATERRAAEMREVADIIDALKPIAKHFALDSQDPAQVLEAIARDAQEVPFSELDVKQHAYNAAAGAIFPRIQARLLATMAKLDAAEKEIAALHQSAPGTSGAGTAPAEDPQASADKHFLDALLGQSRR